MQILKGHDHVIESVCFGKKPPTAVVPVPVALAAVASLNLLDTSQKSGKTDDTSLVDIIGVNEHLFTSYCLPLIAFERGLGLRLGGEGARGLFASLFISRSPFGLLECILSYLMFDVLYCL